RRRRSVRLRSTSNPAPASSLRERPSCAPSWRPRWACEGPAGAGPSESPCLVDEVDDPGSVDGNSRRVEAVDVDHLAGAARPPARDLAASRAAAVRLNLHVAARGGQPGQAQLVDAGTRVGERVDASGGVVRVGAEARPRVPDLPA